MNIGFLKSNKGTTMILFTFLMTALIGVAAIVIDIWRVSLEKQMLQNAIDATALAAAQDLPDDTKAIETANQYITANGYKPSDITITFSDSNYAIVITASKKVEYTLAKVLGYDSTILTERASAALSGVDSGPFNYAVFAGGGMAAFNGSKHIFDGSVYGRDGVSLGNKAQVLHGNAVSSNNICGPSDISFGNGGIITDNPVIHMPDFSELIKKQGVFCTNQEDFYSKFNGKSIDGPVYINGDLTINGRIKGIGIIYATGTIDYTPDQDSTDSIVFYAGGIGGMTFNGGTGKIYGIMYAPNGTIRVNGGPNGIVYGRIVAQKVDVNGAKFSVYSSLHDLDGLNTLISVKLVQ